MQQLVELRLQLRKLQCEVLGQILKYVRTSWPPYISLQIHFSDHTGKIVVISRSLMRYWCMMTGS